MSKKRNEMIKKISKLNSDKLARIFYEDIVFGDGDKLLDFIMNCSEEDCDKIIGNDKNEK